MRGSVAIIGAGRVGRSLGRSLREHGWRIGAVVSRKLPSARRAVRFIHAGRPHGGLTPEVLHARVILIATPDRAMAGVARELAELGGRELEKKIVLHTSGALDSGVLAPLRECGAAIGSLHPLQTFSGVGAAPLDGRVFAIEGDAAALRAAREIARSLGGVPVRIPGGKKPLYHAACVLAAGHTLALLEAAAQLMMSIGMNRREAARALIPLTRQVLDNFEKFGPVKAWTGPLARGDYEVIAAHAAVLQNFPPEFAAAHEALNRLGAAILARHPEEARRGIEPIFAGRRVLKKASGGDQ